MVCHDPETILLLKLELRKVSMSMVINKPGLSLTHFARPAVCDVGVAAVVLDAVGRVLEPAVGLRALEVRLGSGRRRHFGCT